MFYRLNGRDVVPCSQDEWGAMFADGDARRVAEYVQEGVAVSTVFLGLDHSYTPGGPPILFETMIFGGSRDGEQYRYATYDEALDGHNRVVASLRGDPK